MDNLVIRNKVLMICSNFPPIRNGGTIRCEKLAKYIADFNWETVVITKKPKKQLNYNYEIEIPYCKVYRTPPIDVTSMFAQVKSGLTKIVQRWMFVFRGNLKSNSGISNSVSVKRRLSEYILIPDPDILWALLSIPKAYFIVKREKPKLIFSSGPGHSVHILGFFLKIITRKKWVVEFRDPWTMNPFNIAKPFKLLASIDNYLEKLVLKNADKINVTSEQYKTQFLKKYNFINSEKITTIPNGYDPDDFIAQTPITHDKFTIVHSGNFYKHRKSDIFVNALISLMKEKLINYKNIEIRFVGMLDPEGLRIIEKSEFSTSFTQLGYVSHAESINEICSADLLLLIPGPGMGTMPGKFYEYLAASKPIFCIADEGPAKEIILKNNLGMVSGNDPSEIAIKVLTLIESIKTKNFGYPDVLKLKNNFNRQNIAEQMVNLYNSL